MFFSFFALILVKALSKRVFFLYFALTLSKALPQRVFFLFLPYYQSPTKKGVFLYFELILTKSLPKRVFSSIFALISTKAQPKKVFYIYFCPFILYQNPTKKGVFFPVFCVYFNKIPTKKRSFTLFLPLF